MANMKSGAKDSGSVGDLSGAGSVTRNETSKSATFAEGGNTPMFGQQHVGEQKPGGTAHDVGSDGKFAVGGSGKMFGFSGSMPARDGITSAR